MIFQLLRAMSGESGVVQCAFVESNMTEADYFSTPLELGVSSVCVCVCVCACAELTFSFPFSLMEFQKTLDYPK